MPPDRELLDATPGEMPPHEHVQQLIEAEAGRGAQGIRRCWQASDSRKVVLTSDATGVRISRDNGATDPAQVVVDGTPAGGNLSGAYPNPSLSPTTLAGLVKVGDPAGGVLAGTYPNPSLAVVAIDALIPPGTVWAYAGGSTPAGWLRCDGSVVSRTTYVRLFAVISTAYNTGGEAGTDFRLPNLGGRVPLGISGTHPLATTGGAESVGVSAPGLPHTHDGSHNHGLNGHIHPTDHNHPYTVHHDHLGAHPTSTSSTPAAAGNVKVTASAGPSEVPLTSSWHEFDVPAIPNPTTRTSGFSSAPSTAAPSPTTTTEGSTAAPAAVYPAPGSLTVPTMTPFLAMAYMIRTGA